MSAPTSEPVAITEAPPAETSALPISSGAPGNEGASGQTFHSASLYVGDLAPDVNEGLLFEIFNAVGPVASIRVCRDGVTRRSLGYSYINFHQVADAERALDTMNYTMIKSRPCRIMWSQRDPSIRRSGVGNIFVKNLHVSIDNKQLYDTFSLFGNILSCKVVTERESGNSMGYGYVHYETAEAANAAIDKLDGMLIDGQEVQVGHFMRKNDRPGLADWTNCYVKSIPLDWDDAMLLSEFAKYGEVISATIAMGIPKKVGKKKVYKGEKFGDDKKVEKEEPKAEDADKEKELESDAAVASKDVSTEEEEKPIEEKTKPKPQSLGYGFINFVEHEAAIAAIENLNGKEYTSVVDGEEKTTELFVSRAQKKAERERELRAKFDSMKVDRISKFQGVNLYVKNLDDSVTDDMLRDEFSAMGTITSARVMKDMKDGRSRGFGFVCYSTPEEATRAVNEMNGKILVGKPIFVALAQRKEVRRAQLENLHSSRGPGGGQGQQPNAGMMRGPMGPMGGYPGGPMPVYMNRPGVQPMYPMMTGMMAGNGQQPRGGAAAGGQPRYPQMMQQRAYPMPAYGVVPQPGRGGRGPGNQGGRGGRGGRGPMAGGSSGRGGNAPQQQLKFNQQVRNAAVPPTTVPSATQTQAAPAQPTPPQANESLTPSALASATPEMQKNMIGERLYPLIHASQPDLAGKITGMLLEMDNSELLHLLESPEALNAKIAEALQVLEAHNATAEPAP